MAFVQLYFSIKIYPQGPSCVQLTVEFPVLFNSLLAYHASFCGFVTMFADITLKRHVFCEMNGLLQEVIHTLEMLLPLVNFLSKMLWMPLRYIQMQGMKRCL